MNTTMLSRMSGEELFLLQIVQGGEFAAEIDAELNRRALLGWDKPRMRRPRAASDADSNHAVA